MPFQQAQKSLGREDLPVEEGSTLSDLTMMPQAHKRNNYHSD